MFYSFRAFSGMEKSVTTVCKTAHCLSLRYIVFSEQLSAGDAIQKKNGPSEFHKYFGEDKKSDTLSA